MTMDTKKGGWKPALQTVARDGVQAVQSSKISGLPSAIPCIASNGLNRADYSTERGNTPQQATTPTWKGVLVQWVTPREAHTDAMPFCAVMACACHFDRDRMERYFIGPVSRGEMEIPEAIDRYHCELGYMARKQAEARALEGLVMV